MAWFQSGCILHISMTTLQPFCTPLLIVHLVFIVLHTIENYRPQLVHQKRTSKYCLFVNWIVLLYQQTFCASRWIIRTVATCIRASCLGNKPLGDRITSSFVVVPKTKKLWAKSVNTLYLNDMILKPFERRNVIRFEKMLLDFFPLWRMTIFPDK